MISPKELENYEPPAEKKMTDEQKKLLEKYFSFIEKQKKIQILINYLDYMAGFPAFATDVLPKRAVQRNRRIFGKNKVAIFGQRNSRDTKRTL